MENKIRIGNVGIVGFEDPLWMEDKIRQEHIAWFETIWSFFEQYGANVHTADMFESWDELDYILVLRADYKVFYRVSKLENNVKKIYFAIEPEVVKKEHNQKNIKKLLNIFDMIITPFDDLVDYNKIFPCTVYENLVPDFGCIPFNDRRLLVNVSGYKHSFNRHELYSERIRLIKWFDKQIKCGKNKNEFDLFGQGKWQRIHSESYRGKAENKIRLYHNYKFALALENSRGINGYMTEKLFDCFIAGIVPIYAGADNIEQYVPQNCYIDYFAFPSVEKLIDYIRNMREEEYNGYISNIKNFIADPKLTYRWSADAWKEYLQVIVQYDYRGSTAFKNNLKNKNVGALAMRIKLISLFDRFDSNRNMKAIAKWLNS